MITWAKFRHVSGFHIEELNEMEHKGEMWGAKKEEWFCCFQNMPKEKWLSIEKWNGTNWEPYQQ
jgi:inorganic pyrophosphatase